MIITDNFRPMRRHAQELSFAECEELLRLGSSGTLALLGDGGYPYAVPLSYAYTGGKLYFHCAKEGHKLDAIRACGKASFCVIVKDNVCPEKFSTDYMSVIVFGKIGIVTEEAELLSAIHALAAKYSPDESEESTEKEINACRSALCVLRLDALHISGKHSKQG